MVDGLHNVAGRFVLLLFDIINPSEALTMAACRLRVQTEEKRFRMHTAAPVTGSKELWRAQNCSDLQRGIRS